MKIALVFYSFSGNTQRVINYLRDILLLKNQEVGVLKLKPKDEPRSFLKQGFSAFLKRKPSLVENTPYNLEGFNFVVFASPLWAFTFAPALRSYLEKVEGLGDKKVSFILTYGSGAGLKKASKELRYILENKGARVVNFLALKGEKSQDKKYLQDKFEHFAPVA